MSQRTATITSLPMAFEVVKAMQADGLDWGEGYIRAYARRTREITRASPCSRSSGPLAGEP
jgi:hypothetical protein